MMDSIRSEFTTIYHKISVTDAIAEGGYTPKEFESLFETMYPKWNMVVRYVFEFHFVLVLHRHNGVIWEEW